LQKIGYHHYWLAEHHNNIQFVGTAPEILESRIASATQRIRVANDGVMLSLYSPFKVAETFALLGGLFSGRIAWVSDVPQEGNTSALMHSQR